MNASLKIIPEALRRRRLACTLGQAELAQQVGITASYLSYLENGARGAKPKTIRRLARALGCRPHDISEVIEVLDKGNGPGASNLGKAVASGQQ